MSSKVKVILIAIGMIAVLSYMIYSLATVNGRSEEQTCSDMIINIKDSTELRFVSERDLMQILHKEKINPIGLKMKDINPEKIENILRGQSVIKDVECYKTMSGKIKVDIWQKKPVFRLMMNTDSPRLADIKSFYVDYEKGKIPASVEFAAYVPLVTSTRNLNDEFITSDLFNFIVFLRNDKLWESQFEQIHINNDKEVTLVPRVGNHTILLGTLDNYDKKLNKLMKLYTEDFSTNGWNRYSKINLQYKNQVICTKK